MKIISVVPTIDYQQQVKLLLHKGRDVETDLAEEIKILPPSCCPINIAKVPKASGKQKRKFL